jgi:hypothetical protein
MPAASESFIMDTKSRPLDARRMIFGAFEILAKA